MTSWWRWSTQKVMHATLSRPAPTYRGGGGEDGREGHAAVRGALGELPGAGVEQVSEAGALGLGLGGAGAQQQAVEESGAGARGLGQGVETVQAEGRPRVASHHRAQGAGVCKQRRRVTEGYKWHRVKT